MTLPEPDPDREPLDEALARAGVDGRWMAWDDPEADWDAPVPTIVRSTWNYALDLGAYLGWCERTARAAPMWNPPDVIRANTHKRYLIELAARGVATVPTRLVERAEAARMRVATLGWKRVVIKPAVGAGSLGAKAFDGDDPAADAHVRELAAGVEVLIQPYMDSVDGHGERSLVWIDGEVCHQIRKSPRFAGEAEQVTGPHPIADDERDLALAALAPWADRILYGRVDVARDANGAPVVMELELAEPSLFFFLAPGSAERYVAGLIRRLRAS
jgi:glutathione synthase/RimK-type ligase-like ATP-grasp enzyme